MNNVFQSTLFDESTKIWKGVPQPQIFDSKISIGRAVLFVLDKNPNFVAQISDNSGEQKTNREIYNDTLKVAVNLQEIGCCKGDVVGFVSRNNENLAAAFFAALLLAAPVSAIDSVFTKDEIIHMYGITCPKFIFCESDKVTVLKEALEALKSNAKIIVFGEKFSGLLHIDDLLNDPGDVENFCPPDVDDQTCAVILCSSGTTGLPKGVSLSHKGLLYPGSYGFSYGVAKPCSLICFSSIYWYSGLITLVTTSLTGITRISTTNPYSPDLFYNMIMKYRPAILFTAPIQLSGIINHPQLDESTMDCVKFYVCVGSILPEYLWKNAKKYLKNGHIFNGYGMSEAGFVAREPPNTPRYSAGIIMSGLEVKILDEDDQKLTIGQQGEICMKSEYKFLGYYKNPEETDKILDKDGWIHSGDIGYIDVDGLLHIIGRKKDILKYNNYVVSPIELENLIISIPGVLQVVVVGVPHPVSTDLPAAVVVRQEGSSVTEEDISSVVEKKLSDPKRLRGGIYFVDNIPLTPSGKVRKILVKEMVTKLYRERNS